MEGIQTIELLLFMILMLLVILCGYLFFGQESEKKEKNGMNAKNLKLSQRQKSSATRKGARLISLKTGKTEKIEKTMWYIGKDMENDYVIRENPAVSRRHGCIIWKDGNYYLSDMNSLNGTFVNGNEVREGEKFRLSDRDKIVLADEVFEFQEYEEG